MSSNSAETLQLIASDLEAMLKTHLGQNTYYVLVVSNDLDPESLTNCITNVPRNREAQLRKAFTELGSRHAQMLS